MIRYCTRCVMPETRPHLKIDEEGVCNACRAYENRREVDWDERKRAFLEYVEPFRSKDGSNYDCLIPVSGGKDSTYQVLKCLECGLNPLVVMATTDMLSDIGRANIENLKNLGVDAIEIDVNPLVRRKINKIALKTMGDISWPEHRTIFAAPMRLALQLGIKLVVWGENPENEYGGPDEFANSFIKPYDWLEEFSGQGGFRVSDLVGQDGITKRDLIQYTFPDKAALKEQGVVGIYLGMFFPWDGIANKIIAQAYGFQTYGKAVEGSMVDYQNLDNYQTGIHDYFMYLKYAFGRTTYHASLLVRRGLMTRDMGMDIVRRRDGAFPWTYLGKPIGHILDGIDMSLEEFQATCDKFTNKALFKTDRKGELVRNKDGSPIKLWHDNQ